MTQLTRVRNPRAAPALVVNVFPRLGRFRSCSIFQPFFALRLRGRTRSLPACSFRLGTHTPMVGCFETMTRWIDHWQTRWFDCIFGGGAQYHAKNSTRSSIRRHIGYLLPFPTCNVLPIEGKKGATSKSRRSSSSPWYSPPNAMPPRPAGTEVKCGFHHNLNKI